MANFLSTIGDYIKQTAWDQPVGILKDVGKGDFKGAFNDWRHTFGDNERAESKIANGMGIGGWVGKHPEETAGAVVASIFGGMYAAGAYGATAAGGAGGAAGTAGATGATTSAASAGSALAYTPTTSTVLGGAGSFSGGTSGSLFAGSTAGNAAAATGEGFSFASSATPALSYTPTTSTVLGGSGSGATASTSAGGSSPWLKYAAQFANANQQQQGQQQQQPVNTQMLQSQMQKVQSSGGQQAASPFANILPANQINNTSFNTGSINLNQF